MPTYHTYIPHPPLSQFVEHLWYYEAGDASYTQERVLPSGAAQIIIDLSPENPTGILMCGARSSYNIIQTSWLLSVMGVCYRFGGAFPFFDLPLADLHNLDVPVDALWGEIAVDELRDRLLTAPNLTDRFRTLEQFLLTRMMKPTVQHPAVQFALNAFCQPAAPTVASVTEQIGLSQRHFIQVFSQQVGLTPKRYWRVRRFQEVLRTVASAPCVDWSDLVLHCGYFDQAHFIHDFRAFSGLTPTDYLAQRVDTSNHVPLLD